MADNLRKKGPGRWLPKRWWRVEEDREQGSGDEAKRVEEITRWTMDGKGEQSPTSSWVGIMEGRVRLARW
jgi:hypothetical protein